MAGHTTLFDEKLLAHDSFEPATDLPTRHRSHRRQYLLKRLIPAFVTLLAVFSLFRATFVCHHHYDPALSLQPVGAVEDGRTEEQVPLEIHVMSKCPDARDCLRELIVPTMV